MSSHLQDNLGFTQYSYRTGQFWLDEISALRHGDVVVVHTLVGCVLRWKAEVYIGTIKNYFIFSIFSFPFL